jgi:hypothetical protein
MATKPNLPPPDSLRSPQSPIRREKNAEAVVPNVLSPNPAKPISAVKEARLREAKASSPSSSRLSSPAQSFKTEEVCEVGSSLNQTSQLAGLKPAKPISIVREARTSEAKSVPSNSSRMASPLSLRDSSLQPIPLQPSGSSQSPSEIAPEGKRNITYAAPAATSLPPRITRSPPQPPISHSQFAAPAPMSPLTRPTNAMLHSAATLIQKLARGRRGRR